MSWWHKWSKHKRKTKTNNTSTHNLHNAYIAGVTRWTWIKPSRYKQSKKQKAKKKTCRWIIKVKVIHKKANRNHGLVEQKETGKTQQQQQTSLLTILHISSARLNRVAHTTIYTHPRTRHDLYTHTRSTHTELKHKQVNTHTHVSL